MMQMIVTSLFFCLTSEFTKMVGYQPPSVEDCPSDDGTLLQLVPHTKSKNTSRRSLKYPFSPGIMRGIEVVLGKPGDYHALKTVLRDSTMIRISELLGRSERSDWRLRPRTFCILWWLNCLEAMECFVKERLTDHYIPYTRGNLPKSIKGTDRAKFLELQMKVLLQEDLKNLEIRGAQHLHCEVEDQVSSQFESIEILGNGAFGTVDRIMSRTTLEEFARKRIHRTSNHVRDKRAIDAFENELQALKVLDHKHLVELISTYTDPTSVGLIMKPVADMDLESYLRSDQPLAKRKACMRPFFGCLANALRYLHDNNTRHKDIKPKNILVKGKDVYFTDFGTARRWNGDGNGSTSGPNPARTPRYCAPEVANHDRRDTASDMWSLGCVFLEMATVLGGRTVDDMKAFYESYGTQSSQYWYNQDATSEWIERLQYDYKSSEDGIVLQWVQWMLNPNPRDRPDSHQLLSEILYHEGETTFICSTCMCEHDVAFSKTAQQEDSERFTPDSHIKEIDATHVPSKAFDKDSENITRKQPFDQKTQTPVNENEQASEVPELKAEKKTVRFIEQVETPHSTPNTPVVTDRRFVLLSANRRPQPTTEEPEEKYEDTEEDLLNLIVPDALQQPSVEHDSFSIPRSTFVPSYVLASSNRFTRQEVSLSDYRGRKNLFVYGRFMFPSVLRAIAAKSINGEYSKMHQRRLFPTSDDWVKINQSLKHAAEAMTPAALHGYDRWKPRGIDCAVLQESKASKAVAKEITLSGYPKPPTQPGRVQGFLIRGLTDEALRYLDLLLTRERALLKRLRFRANENPEDDHDGNKVLMRRREVSTQIRLKCGRLETVQADTYVWNDDVYGLCAAWDPERFIQGPGLRSLSTCAKDWTTEERELASTMRIDYVLPGDILCSHVLKNQPDRVASLLFKSRVDPDAPCRVFGTALQAAASLGDDDVVNLLLDYGADADGRGGRFGSPLMASAVGSRKAVTKILLKERADIFVDGGRYVSPLYQAVGHSDWAIAQLLLDNGAWLYEGYEELLDLAAEMRDSDMKRLLVDYDVQNIHRRLPAYANIPLRSSGVRNTSGSLGGVVLSEIWALCGKSGSWKGVKGVQVARAALEAGASPEVLQLARKAWNPVSELFSLLRRETKEAIEDQRRRLGENRNVADVMFERVAGSSSSKQGDTSRSKRSTRKSHSGTKKASRSDGRYQSKDENFPPPPRDPPPYPGTSKKVHWTPYNRGDNQAYRDSPPPYPGSRRDHGSS